MLPRHANELLARLERVAQIGCAEVRKQELLWWYKQERVTVAIWRDIQEKWQDEILDRTGNSPDEAPLLVGYDDQGVYVLVWGEGLTGSKKAWLQDVRILGRLESKAEEDEAA